MTVLMSSEKWKKKKGWTIFTWVNMIPLFTSCTSCFPVSCWFSLCAWDSGSMEKSRYECDSLFAGIWAIPCQVCAQHRRDNNALLPLRCVPALVALGSSALCSPLTAASGAPGRVFGGKRPLCYTTAWQEIYKMTAEEEDKEEKRCLLKFNNFLKHWCCQAEIYRF